MVSLMGKIYAVKTTLTLTKVKAQFLIVQQLCRMSGFGWDEGRQVVTALQDVWDKLAKVHNRVFYVVGFC